MAMPAVRTPASMDRPDLVREVQDLYEQMDHWMSSILGNSNDLLRAWTPLADVADTPDAYLVDVDLPGVKPDDVMVELVGNELIITGELKEKEREGLFRRRTRRVGRFEYRTTLPRDANPDENEVEATTNDGVLTVKIPKIKEARPHRIAIRGK